MCDGHPRARRGERVDLPRGAGRRAARLLPVHQQRARRDRRARRRRRHRRARPAGRPARRCSSASARAAAATRTRCWTACSTTTRWPCKANLRTRLNDMDELVGDIAEQSVYVTLPNPLRARSSWSPPTPTRTARSSHGWMNEPHVGRVVGPAAPTSARTWPSRSRSRTSQPWIAYADGVPFALRGDLPGGRGPAGRALRRASRRPRLPRAGRRARYVGTRRPRELGRVVLERLLADGRAASSASPTSATRACSRSAARSAARSARTLELPDKRAALVVWER